MDCVFHNANAKRIANEFLSTEAKRSIVLQMSRHRYFDGTVENRKSFHNPDALCEKSLSILSTKARSPFDLDGHTWRSCDHYYSVYNATNPVHGSTKRDVMLRALFAKFRQHKKAHKVLMSTGIDSLHADLDEADLYWGVGTIANPGQDVLGELLTHVRAELSATL